MMIGPETYYEFNIKGKTEEQILRKVKSLKSEIAKLKKAMEHPEYAPTMYPTEGTRLWCTREYLKRTKQALADMGKPYIPNSVEKRIIDFDNNIKNISVITFRIGGFFSPWTDYIVRIGEKLQFEVNNVILPEVEKPIDTEYEETEVEEFLSAFADLHIGEWRRHYDLTRYGYFVCDGTQWELTIEYNNGRKPETYSGDNAYPYNFESFVEMMGADYSECLGEDE